MDVAEETVVRHSTSANIDHIRYCIFVEGSRGNRNGSRGNDRGGDRGRVFKRRDFDDRQQRRVSLHPLGRARIRMSL